MANTPPRPPCDLLTHRPVFVGDLAAGWAGFVCFALVWGGPTAWVGVLG